MVTKSLIVVSLVGLIVLLSAGLWVAQAQGPTEEWVARYNGPGNDDDFATAIVLDIRGNIYVTGSSDGGPSTYLDYTTIKYDTNGNQLWEARYNGPGNRDDITSAIAIDGSGNVYVTGWSQGSGFWDDYATVKYDSTGVEQWVRRYNGPGDELDWATAIAVDGSGNVYVSGFSTGSGTDADYLTIKYDTNGNQLWEARYNGPGNSIDKAYALAVDGSGNVYVTGGSVGASTNFGNGSFTNYDYATIKYDTNGNQLWVIRYNWSGNADDFARALAIDGSGNIYVTGQSYGGELDTRWDYTTIKYNGDGVQQWVRRYNKPGYSDNSARALAVDDAGNVYVTGNSQGYIEMGLNSASDYATVGYDTNGYQLWAARYSGPDNNSDFAYAVAVDDSGSVYVTGKSWDPVTDFDCVTIKYDSAGVEQWRRKYNGPGNGGDGAYGIGVDNSGNVYVTGWSQGLDTKDDLTTIKYSQPAPSPPSPQTQEAVPDKSTGLIVISVMSLLFIAAVVVLILTFRYRHNNKTSR